MPKKAPELSPLQVKRLTKPGVHAVGGVAGLLLQVTPTGARSWILRATVGAKRRDIGLGGFPDVTLAQARDKARAAREQITQGIDPVAERKAAQARLRAEQAKVITFDEAASRCHQAKAHEFRNAKHKADWISSLNRYASPLIGNLPVSEIEHGHIMQILEPIWTTKTETATRVRQRIEAVLKWAKVGGFREGDNPAQWKDKLEFALPRASKIRKHINYPALPWQEVPAFMADLRERDGMGARALELIILTAARSGEVRLAVWSEFDLQARLWVVPADRIKAGKEHKVPLSDAALKLLKALPTFGEDGYLFTAPRGGPLSDMSISAVCRRMAVDAVPHGFRSSFKDWARNRSAYPDEVSELALAHVNSDATRAAYARDELLPQRKKLMAEWAKYCSNPPVAGEVVSLKGAAGER